MRLLLLMTMLWLAAVSRCDEPRSEPPPPDPKPGDSVRLRGTLGEDVDCRTFKVEDGKTYSLSARLRNYANGTRLCIRGSVSEASACIVTPTIDVQSVASWASCH